MKELILSLWLLLPFPVREGVKEWYRDRDFPYLSDLQRFPTNQQFILNQIEFSEQYESWINRRLDLKIDLELTRLTEMKMEIKRRQAAWKALGFATGAFYGEYYGSWYHSVHCRRDYLNDLRNYLGETAYLSGKMPTPVPFEWLRRYPPGWPPGQD